MPATRDEARPSPTPGPVPTPRLRAWPRSFVARDPSLAPRPPAPGKTPSVVAKTLEGFPASGLVASGSQPMPSPPASSGSQPMPSLPASSGFQAAPTPMPTPTSTSPASSRFQATPTPTPSPSSPASSRFQATPTSPASSEFQAAPMLRHQPQASVTILDKPSVSPFYGTRLAYKVPPPRKRRARPQPSSQPRPQPQPSYQPRPQYQPQYLPVALSRRPGRHLTVALSRRPGRHLPVALSRRSRHRQFLHLGWRPVRGPCPSPCFCRRPPVGLTLRLHRRPPASSRPCLRLRRQPPASSSPRLCLRRRPPVRLSPCPRYPVRLSPRRFCWFPELLLGVSLHSSSGHCLSWFVSGCSYSCLSSCLVCFGFEFSMFELIFDY